MTIKELKELLEQFDENSIIALEKFDECLKNDVFSVYQDYDGTIIISEYEEHDEK